MNNIKLPTETVFQIFDNNLLKAIYKQLIKSRGANVRIIARKFQFDPEIKVDGYKTDEPISIPRFVPFEIREVSQVSGDVRVSMRGELSYAEIMNLFDHIV